MKFIGCINKLCNVRFVAFAQVYIFILFYIFLLVVDAILNMQLSVYKDMCGFQPLPAHTLSDLVFGCSNGFLNLKNIHKEFGMSTKSLYHSKSMRVEDIMSKMNTTNQSFDVYSIRQLATLSHFPNAMRLMHAYMITEEKDTNMLNVSRGLQIKREEFDEIVSSWIGLKSDDVDTMHTSQLLAMIINGTTGMSGNRTRSKQPLSGYVRQWHGEMKIFAKLQDLMNHHDCGQSVVTSKTLLTDIVKMCNISGKYLTLFNTKDLERISIKDLSDSGMVSVNTSNMFTIISVADSMMRKAGLPIIDHFPDMIMPRHMQSMNVSELAANITGIKHSQIISKIFPIGNLSSHNISSLASALNFKNAKQIMLLSLSDIVKAKIMKQGSRQDILHQRILHKSHQKSFKYLNKDTRSKTILQIIDHFFSLNVNETQNLFKLSSASMKVLGQLTLAEAMKVQRRIMFDGDDDHITIMDLLTYLTKTFSQPGIKHLYNL